MDEEHTGQVLRTKLPRKARFIVYGKTYRGVASLRPPRREPVQPLEDCYFSYYRSRHGHWILRRCELFPCFDEHDRMFENRYFRRYFICDSEAMLRDAYAQVHSTRDELESLAQRLPLPPLVRADDDTDWMFLTMPAPGSRIFA